MVRLTHLGARWSPWSGAAGGLWAAALAAGLALCAAGWWLGAGETTLDRQITPANISACGAIVIAGASLGWIRHGHASVRRRRNAVTQTLQPLLAVRSVAVVEVAVASALVYAGAGLGRFHLGSCEFCQGREWPARTRAEAIADGLTACGVCRP